MGEYFTIEKGSSVKTKVKGSIFIGNAFPVENKEDAVNKIKIVSKKYYDATHNPFAFKIETGDIRYSDDREPPGTAGKPILGVIEKFDLTNILIVISRYFGGIKLGKGGLSRAYKDCAEKTIQSTTIIKKAVII
ncbi:YigZ family protein, partial [candidate division KSB1 bacterium]